MGVIKASDAAAQRAGAFSMADIEKQAHAILAAARLRAERLLLAAQREADDLKRQAMAEALEQGRREGLAKGLEEGRKQGRDQALAERRQDLAQVLTALSQAAQQFDQSRLDLEAAARSAVAELAIAIAARVTKRQGALDPQVLTANLDEALRLVVSSIDVRIAIHPTQMDALQQAMPAIAVKWPRLKHIDLIADGTLAPGGCRVFSAGGQIDADLNLQLDRIATELIPSPAEGG